MALEKKYNPQGNSDKAYEKWEKSGAFDCDVTSNKQPFTIMMPPPNVTGSLHMGHALNATLQDILIRYNRMNGRDALWQPGTDHAGIATQMVVERQLDEKGVSRKGLGREAFLEKVWEWKAQSGGTITTQLRKLGASPDWHRERFTMDEGLSHGVVKAFVQLYKEGLIYKDKRLVNWDPKFHTAISDLEVEQKETKSHMWHIAYPIEGEEARTITVATTRPETMLGDTGIAVHPEDERYKDLIGKYAVLPIVGRLIPIVADEHADPEQGSGAVKITPAHDFNDFEVGKRHNLEMISIFDENACLNNNVPENYIGIDRYDARKKVLSELEDLDAIVKVDDHIYQLPYGDRSGLVIEPMLTDQWFCDAKTLAQKPIEAVETGKMQFVPKQWENTFFSWMRDIQPWCISRQLWWGHQIPAWYGPDGTVFVEENEEDAKLAARAHYGEDVRLARDKDVLDTWFSSALWPFSTLGWPDQTPELAKYYPGEVLVTAFDIIFFWVARMMMMGMHFMGDVPFKTIYMHALVRDSKGQKMSKSKGNVIDPLELVNEYGADALRFTLAAMAAPGRDIRLSEKRVEGYRNFGTKLWNAARYCEMNDALPQQRFDINGANLSLNKWIIQELNNTVKSIEKSMENYRYDEAAATIYDFVWKTFCDWYLEFTKPLLNGNDADMAAEIRTTTGWVLSESLKILNIFMPFITEELYDQIVPDSLKDTPLLLQAEWPSYDSAVLNDDVAAHQVNWMIDLVSEIRSVRADMHVPASAKTSLLIKGASEATKGLVEQYLPTIQFMARIEDVTFVDDFPAGSVQSVVREATIALPIADLIDLGQERERLAKEIKKLEQDIKKIDGKLGNEKFVQNAPEEVIEEQRSRKANAEATRNKLSNALAQLEKAA